MKLENFLILSDLVLNHFKTKFVIPEKNQKHKNMKRVMRNEIFKNPLNMK